jgi:hypothetical protein
MIQHHHDGRFQNERKKSAAPLPGMTVNAKDKYLIADMIPINLTMMPASGPAVAAAVNGRFHLALF